MKKVKISLAAIAFLLSAGATLAFTPAHNAMATKANTANDCTSVPNSQTLDRNSSTDCGGTRIVCCYQQGTSNPFPGALKN